MARFESKLRSRTDLPDGWARTPITKSRGLKTSHFISQNKILVGLLLFATLSTLLTPVFEGLKPYVMVIKTSLVDIPNIPWEGTTMPIKEMGFRPNMTKEDRTLHFDLLPANKKAALPEYNISVMKRGLALGESDQQAWFTYLAFPVPHGGNYTFDATEFTGSHPGIDISTNPGTPIYAMASGIITTSKSQAYGFGNHVIITHPNVPSPENPNTTTTLRSVYGHMSENFTKVGQVVKKGQLIGKVGSSGTATAPHLHWQIERPSAPYAGYWPFSMTEIKEQGITSFFEGVRQGVGLDKLKAHTVHPATYVNSYRNDTEIASSGTLDAQVYTPQASVNIKTKPPVNQNSPLNKLEVFTPKGYTPGSPAIFTIKAASPGAFASPVSIRTSLGSLSTINPSQLISPDFINNEARFTVTTNSRSGYSVFVEGIGGVFASEKVNVKAFSNSAPVEVVEPIQQEVIQEVKEVPQLIEKEPEPVKQVETPPANNQSSSINLTAFFPDVSRTSFYGAAVMAWVAKGVIKGYEDGQFKPEWAINRAEALKILMQAKGVDPGEGSTYSDVPESAWFAPWVASATQKGIVKGYDDGLFRPGKQVSRAEFLKMALETSDRFVPPVGGGMIAPDVPASAWHAKYFSWAIRHKALPSYLGSLGKPNDPLTRGEAVYILDKVME